MAYFVRNRMERNYYFKDRMAFTEDHIRVRKLILWDVPCKLNKIMLNAHFSDFGRVGRVHLSRKTKQFTYRTVNVVYDKAGCAARALRESNHEIDGIELWPWAGDSWKQPDAYGTNRELRLHRGPSPILDLNDDCLQFIMAHLGLQDQVRFARTCMRFRAVYRDASARLHTSVELGQFRDMTAWDISDFFKLSGAHVQVLYDKPDYETRRYVHAGCLADSIADHCMNLRSLRLFNNPQLEFHLKLTLARMHQLEELQLESTNAFAPSVPQNLKQLKILNLSCNSLTGNSLRRKLPVSIEVLGLNECRNFDAKWLPGICKRLSNLKELNIQNVITSNKEIFKTMVTKNLCPSLETLRMTACRSSGYEFVAQLPKLKHLTIYTHRNDLDFRAIISKELIDQLVMHKADQLEQFEVFGSYHLSREQLKQIAKLTALRVLILRDIDLSSDELEEFANLKQLEKICFGLSSATNSMILQVLSACPKLNYLRLKANTKPDAELVLSIVNQVRHEIANKDMQRELPIELWSSMNDEQIKELILTSSEVVPEDIIQIKCSEGECGRLSMDYKWTLTGLKNEFHMEMAIDRDSLSEDDSDSDLGIDSSSEEDNEER
ncbi:uncharacterized protein LOC128256662 isoform X1 [Drosophila gunungcola]|uniref:uncharacterized protein LOC128256662 isoform X1 n=1 Tax=Drosophila gunungcola TaxID=103775 RepID=UPI0022E38B5C|nr:uncharacterized protein LOC128256662 isoform X1 [Drosophila gunungcola]XP_052843121.1 uncharacterized protein LOC128256662 isoform X1 [Drosophila gunungcola]